MRTVAVINLGLKSIRLIVFDTTGRKLYFDSYPVTTILAKNVVEQNIDDWWGLLCKLLSNFSLKSTLSKIDFLTVTASSSCLVCVDENLNQLAPVMMVSDNRGNISPQSSEYSSKEINQLFKINWLQSNLNQKTQHKIYKYLSPNDYLLAKLTGKLLTDPLNGRKFGFNNKLGDYDEKVLNRFKINKKHLPDVHLIGTKIGLITAEECQYSFLQKTEVYLTTYDAICAFWASGISKPGDAADISGTVTSVRALSNNINGKSEKLFIQEGLNNDELIVGGSNNLGGGLIEWAKQCFYDETNFSYEKMEADALKEKDNAKGLIFLPYLLGERAPIWDSLSRGIFWGLERHHKKGALILAIFESCAFITMSLVENIKKIQDVHQIYLSGGLARINLISEIKANCLGIPAFILNDFETTALGAALIVLLKSGQLNNINEANKILNRVC